MRVVQPTDHDSAACPTFGNAEGEQLEVGTLAALDREDWPRDVAVYYLHEEQDGQEQGAWYPGVAEGFDANTNSLWVRFNDEPDAHDVDITQDPVVWATPQESRPIAQSSRTQVSHRAHTHTRARTHARTHTHTHTRSCDAWVHSACAHAHKLEIAVTMKAPTHANTHANMQTHMMQLYIG